MMIHLASGSYKLLADTGAISTTPCVLTGFYVNNTTAGVINLRDGGSSGTVIDGDITPAIGWHFYPASFRLAGGAYLTLVSGAINVTLVFNPTPIS